MAAIGQILEDFSDGEFLSNPGWYGDTSLFTVTPDLHLRSMGNPISETISLATSSSRLKNQVWEFWVECDFSPSSSNFVRIFLAADTGFVDPRGYYLKFGGKSGAGDGIDLYVYNGSNDSRLIKGRDSLFGKDKNFAWIRAKRSFEGEWELEIDTNRTGGNYLSMGSAIDTGFSSAQSFLIQFKHTSTRKDLFQFDDLKIKNGLFELLGAKQNSFGNILVEFSSPLSTINPISSSDISIGPEGLTPSFIQIHPFKKNILMLDLPISLDEGQHWIRVKNIKDNENNIIWRDSISIFIYENKINFRDITINEIFFDPSPQIGLPKGEFVELFNSSESTFQLSRLSLVLGSRSASLPNLPIFPGEHIILCKDDFEDEYRFLGKTIGLKDFPTLINSGGTLSLILDDSIVIDRASYSSSFFSDPESSGGGISLEQIDPLQSCPGAGNWDGSVAPEGGTPGSRNSIFNDPISPTQNVLLVCKTIGKRFLELEFSGPVDSRSLSPRNFRIQPFNQVTSFEISDSVFLNKVLLTLDQEMVEGSIYSMDLDSLRDCNGQNILISGFMFGYGVDPEFGDLVISEFLPVPSSVNGFRNEFIELHNPSQKLLDLEGVTITDGASQLVLEDKVMFPGSYLILSKEEDPLFPPEVSMIQVSNLPSLNNSGDTILLRSKNGNTLQFLNYTREDFSEDLSGRSIEMIHPAGVCLRKNVWKINLGDSYGSPGYQNQNWDPNFELPELKITYAYFLDSILVLRLNQSIDSSKSSNSVMGLSSKDQFISHWRISPGLHDFLYSANPIPMEKLRLEGIETCSGESSGTNWVQVDQPRSPEGSSLLINEILFNPFSTGTDFIEIHNPSPFPVLIDGIKIGNRKGGLGSQVEIFPVRSPIPYILPKGYLALTGDTMVLKSRFPFSPSKNFIQLSSFPSLPDDAGHAILMCKDQLLDSLKYNKEMHFELLDDLEGVSLERINPNLPTNDPDNWTSASSTSGFGTPGALNSQRKTPMMNSDQILIHPQIFSPDGDGYQDLVEISIPPTNKTSSVTIEIFNTQGVPIRRLASNSILGNKNIFYWDGLNNKNVRVTFGNYIVLVSVIDPNGKPARFKKIVGVGGYIK